MSTPVRAAPTWDERIGARIQRTYADILKHGKACRNCALPGVRCETADALYQAYNDAESAR
ncbi:hypothetical protein [Actinacidiphila oryziradicis]|uniref:hypothetical protein n=1 Tax=Actinacidiphila oryziradicis TaxID=2571141 RepID=UPI0023F17D3D|nr:hypothetical protein [Actinacidiphila oryziradicis]